MRLLLAVLCLVLAVFAQRRFDHRGIDNLAFLFYGVAGVLFALTFGDIALERVLTPAASAEPGRDRFAKSVRVVTVLLVVALLGCLDFGGNRFRPRGFLLWGGGVFLCLLYLYLSEAPKAFGERVAALFSHKPFSIPRIWLGLGIAVLVGAVLRLHQLDVIPADIGWDLPYNYTDALSILNGQYRIFFPSNQGREGLFFYLIVLVTRLAPLSHFSIKLTSALVGIATIPALYLLGRKLFNPSVGLVAAFLLALNRWHIVLSRSGFRVILLPIFTILLLYTVVRALQNCRPVDFALAGWVMGLGLYTYTAYIFAVLAVFAGLVVYAFSAHAPRWRTLWPLLALMIAVALVVGAPLARFALEHPEQYLQRMGVQVRIVTGDPNRPQMTLPLILENVRTSLLMYNVYGDSNKRFNVPGVRHFGFVGAVLLVLGLSYTLFRWRRGSNSILLLLFFMLIVPMTVSMVPHEMPNIFRAAGTIGPALVLAALALVAVGSRIHELGRTFPRWDLRARLRVTSLQEAHELVWDIGRRGLLTFMAILIIALVLVAELRETRRFYFSDFAEVLPDRQNVSIGKEIAKQIEAYGDVSSTFVKGWPHWFDGRALRTYLRLSPEAPDLVFLDLAPNRPPLSSVAERALFIVHPDDTAGLQTLREVFPHHATVERALPGGTLAFVAVYVER